MKVKVQRAVRGEPFLPCEGSEVDAYVTPSGARYDYRGPRIVAVHGRPTAWDEVCFVRHLARRAAGAVRVLGVTLGGQA